MWFSLLSLPSHVVPQSNGLLDFGLWLEEHLDNQWAFIYLKVTHCQQSLSHAGDVPSLDVAWKTEWT